MKKKILLTLLFSCSLFCLTLQAQIVTTFAGSGAAGSDNGTGTAASFNGLTGIAIDAAGNLYVADEGNNLIRKITADGVVTTFAGSGLDGAADGTGTDASFFAPHGVAVDGYGNVYVADMMNNLIRKITPEGVVTTFAGSGAAGADNGTGNAASFNTPLGVAIDASGNILVADAGNNLIRTITPSGVVSTFAGTGATGSANGTLTSASFNTPVAIVADALGTIYVSDEGNNIIRKITSDGTVSTLAGSGSMGSDNGVGTSASFYGPDGMAIDAAGNLYVAEAANNLIRKITPDGTVTTFAGSGNNGAEDGTGTSASFWAPNGIVIDADGNFFVAEYVNSLVRKMTNVATAIEESSSVSNMSLYPVPARQTLTLTLNVASAGDLKLELVNASGIKVAATEAPNCSVGFHELTLSVATLPTGLYVANVYANGQMKSERVVVE